MFTSGAYVAEQLSDLTDAQIQPNGVDLTLEMVLEPIDAGKIGTEGKTVGSRQAVPPSEVTEDGRTYYLPPGAYIAQYGETVTIPDGHIGFILPRSSLLRNGCMLHTAVWDAGYTGRGEGLLTVHHDIEIEEGARIGQLVLAEANHSGTYDGSYQGERTETT